LLRDSPRDAFSFFTHLHCYLTRRRRDADKRSWAFRVPSNIRQALLYDPENPQFTFTLLRCAKPSAYARSEDASNGSPVAIDAVHFSSTDGSIVGSCTACLPRPSISFSVVPVYSNQRRLYQQNEPSAFASHTEIGDNSPEYKTGSHFLSEVC
jgi:hypothetical protein